MPRPGRLQDRAVASAPEVTTPERVVPGTWHVWPVLRDPGTPEAIARGDLDDRLDELRQLSAAHDAPDVLRACRARLATLGEG